MGKRKLPMEKIEHKRRRTVVKNKRRNGLLKKAVELSLLCDQKIYLVVYDNEYDRMIQFKSDENFDVDIVANKLGGLMKKNTKLSLRTYTNQDFYKDLDRTTTLASEVEQVDYADAEADADVDAEEDDDESASIVEEEEQEAVSNQIAPKKLKISKDEVITPNFRLGDETNKKPSKDQLPDWSTL